MRVLQFIARGFVVAFFLLGHAVIWFVGWLALLLAFRGVKARRRWFGHRLCALMRALGATFIKVGQIMSTRPDLLPPHVIRALETLQDDVGAFAWRHVERTFVEDFGRQPEEVFEEFERAPLASASVAQVHRARRPDGTELAVKVRRPRLETIVTFDLTVMRLFAQVIAVVPSFRLLAPVESVEEFARAIRMQIDLSIEADSNRRFRDNFADDRDVDFPELVPELCSRRVLTMTYVDGVKVLEVDREQHDAKRLARVGFHTLLAMIFDHGFVHADLHPGNILVTDDGTVVILDLGLTAELDETYRRAFARYFAAWAQGDGTVMARLMHDLSPSAHVADYDAFEAEISEFVARYHGKQLGEVQVSTVAFDMMNILRRHRVRVNPIYTMCNIAIAVTEGIGKQLAPDLDLMQETVPFFAKLQMAARM